MNPIHAERERVLYDAPKTGAASRSFPLALFCRLLQHPTDFGLMLHKMQQKSDRELYWPKIEAFKRRLYLTWPEVAEKIGVTVAMLMMVKTGKRNLSQKAQDRFENAEVEAGIATVQDVHFEWMSRSQRADRIKVTAADIRRGHITVAVDYKLDEPGPEYPKKIRLTALPPTEAALLLPLIAGSKDGYELFLKSIPPRFRKPWFINLLKPLSVYAMICAGIILTYGETDGRDLAELIGYKFDE